MSADAAGSANVGSDEFSATQRLPWKAASPPCNTAAQEQKFSAALTAYSSPIVKPVPTAAIALPLNRSPMPFWRDSAIFSSSSRPLCPLSALARASPPATASTCLHAARAPPARTARSRLAKSLPSAAAVALEAVGSAARVDVSLDDGGSPRAPILESVPRNVASKLRVGSHG